MQIFHHLNMHLIFLTGDLFEGTNVHEQVHFFNQTILNIFHNYITKKTILCNVKIQHGLKLVSAIFYQSFIFHQTIAFQKL